MSCALTIVILAIISILALAQAQAFHLEINGNNEGTPPYALNNIEIFKNG
jgi:hypothetical protein